MSRYKPVFTGGYGKFDELIDVAGAGEDRSGDGRNAAAQAADAVALRDPIDAARALDRPLVDREQHRIAAAQLASALLVAVALVLVAERRARARMRFAEARPQPSGGQEARPVVLHGGLALLAWSLCAIPVAFGFVLPLVILVLLAFHQLQLRD